MVEQVPRFLVVHVFSASTMPKSKFILNFNVYVVMPVIHIGLRAGHSMIAALKLKHFFFCFYEFVSMQQCSFL